MKRGWTPFLRQRLLPRFFFFGALGAVGGGRFCVAAGDLAGEASPAVPKTFITSTSARLLQRGRSMEFTGEVRLTRGPDFLTADRLITEENGKVARAFGRVYFRRDDPGAEVSWEVWGDRGIYETETASGTLWGQDHPARAVRVPRRGVAVVGGAIHLEAPRILLSKVHRATGQAPLAADWAEASGGVYIRSVEEGPEARVTELWGERTNYDGRLDQFQLQGGFLPWADAPLPQGASLSLPFGRQTQGRQGREVTGETLTLYPDQQRLTVQRRVQTQIVFERKSASTRATKGGAGVASR